MIDATRLRGSCPDHPRYQAGCLACQSHAAARRRHRHRLLAYGRWEGMTDTAEAREHLAHLLAGGMSQRAVATASGVARTVIGGLASGELRLARAATVAAVLATKLHLPPTAWISSLGTSRRLQSLMAIGWDSATLATRLGVSASLVASWRWRKEPLIRHRHHQAVADLYRQLADRPGPNEMARRQAKYLGYPPPIHWDDDGDLDSPRSRPKCWPSTRTAA